MHILVIDDDERLRALIIKYLTKQGWFATPAFDAFDAEKKLKFFIFDAIILDVMMPIKNGIEFVYEIKDKISAPILMLTAMAEAEDRIKGLESGVDDYLTKPFEPRELVLRIENLVKRVPQKTKEIKFSNLTFNIENSSLFKNNEQIYLTNSEETLLAILMKNAGKPLSREYLIQNSDGAITAERNIDVQITRLRKKIEENPSRPVHIQTMRGAGYILRI